MPLRPCPACKQPAPRFMKEISETALVNYYRCGACGHVFSVAKDAPDGPHRDVTLPRGEQ